MFGDNGTMKGGESGNGRGKEEEDGKTREGKEKRGNGVTEGIRRERGRQD